MVLILEQLTLCSCFCMDLIYTGRSTFARFISLFNNVSTIHQEAVQASSCTESIHRCVKSRSMQMRGQLAPHVIGCRLSKQIRSVAKCCQVLPSVANALVRLMVRSRSPVVTVVTQHSRIHPLERRSWLLLQ